MLACHAKNAAVHAMPWSLFEAEEVEICMDEIFERSVKSGVFMDPRAQPSMIVTPITEPSMFITPIAEPSMIFTPIAEPCMIITPIAGPCMIIKFRQQRQA